MTLGEAQARGPPKGIRRVEPPALLSYDDFGRRTIVIQIVPDYRPNSHDESPCIGEVGFGGFFFSFNSPWPHFSFHLSLEESRIISLGFLRAASVFRFC